MNFTSKQRSYLKGLASTEDAIFQIGKSSITPSLVQAIVSSKQEKSQNYTSEIGGGFYEKSRHYGGHIQPDP